MGKEITPLTGLRGIAACWVVFYHTFKANLEPHPGPIANLLVHGYLAVDIFFVLSGFVMAMSYGQLFSAGFSMVNFRIFLLRRLARIYPLYFVMIFFALAELVLVAHQHFALPHLIALLAYNLALIDSWGFGGPIDLPSWSISTEAAAYLLFPALAALLLYGSRLAAVIGALACLAMVAALAHTPTPLASLGHRTGPLDIYYSGLTVIRCVAEFAIGLVAFRAAQKTNIISAFAQPWVAWVLAIAIIALLMINNSDVLFVCLIAPLVIVLAVGDSFMARALQTAPAMHLGRLSYAIYLLHWPMLSIKHMLIPHFAKFLGPVCGEALAFVIFFAAVLGAAALCYRYIETPGRNFMRGLETSISPRAPAVVELSKSAVSHGVSPRHSGPGKSLSGLCCNFLRGAHEGVFGSAGPSGRFEFEVRVDELDRFGKGRGSKAEGAFDNSGFADNVIRDVEG